MAIVSNAQARAAMAAWTTDTGVKAFGDADNRDAGERVRYALAQASSMLSMLSAACNDAHTLIRRGETSELYARNANIMGAALEGVGALVDLAAFLGEE